MEIRSWWKIGLPRLCWITQPSLSNIDARPLTHANAATLSGPHWIIARTWELAQESPLLLQAPRLCLLTTVHFACSSPLPSWRSVSISPPPCLTNDADSVAG